MSHDPSDPSPPITPDNAAAVSEAGPAAESAPSTDAAGGGMKIKIGSQRPETKRPETQRVRAVAQNVLAQKAPQKVPVPNLRSALPEELEQEVAAALEGFSLNEIPLPVETPPPESTAGDGTRRRGRVLKVHNQDVFVDLGGRDQGIVPFAQFSEPPQPGSMVDVTVGRQNPEDGLFQLSLPGAALEAGDWSQVAEGGLIEVRSSGSNKGGLECEVAQLRGFIPAGQVSLYRVENFEEFVGQRLVCLVTEVNPERRRLVLSRRAVLEREKAEAKQRMMAELAVGQTREGTVRSLMDFGAFVDLGGVDGLIHVSRLSWQRVKHPSELLQTGQAVQVKVVSIDAETGKIGLSLRDLVGDPWTSAALKYKQGDVIRGPVVRVLDKVGAFVALEPGVDGMVHISEIAHQRVFRVGDFLQEGREVEAKILAIDAEARRISLSVKALLARPEPVKKEQEPELPEADPAVPPAPLPPQPKKLKGGIGKKSGGAQFGLKW